MLTKSDKLEVLDLVQRKEPITLREMMEQTSVYSEDDTYTALKWGEEEGLVERREGNLYEDGTTRDLWEWVGDES